MSYTFNIVNLNKEYENFKAAANRSPGPAAHSSSPRSFQTRIKKFFGLDDPSIFHPPPPVDGRKTLILDLDETLVHSADYPPHDSVPFFLSGDPPFYVYKRPGLDGFLSFCHEKFDTFIFTYGDRLYAEPVLDVLCPFIDNSHRLYRDACEIKSGGVKKDLGIFQRSKKELILVDDNSAAVHFNPKNTISIERWVGVPFDRALIDWLPPILEECARADDVRTVIAKYSTQKKKHR